MQGAAALVLVLAHARFCLTCTDVNGVLICRSIPAEFSPGYQVLYLGLQNVGTINSTVFHRNGFSSITELILDGSGITQISENAFSSALQLSSVSLDRNRLSEMNPKWFGDPAVLHHLRLSENQIEVVNATALHGLTSLKELRLNKNRIRTINPDSFSSLDSLTEVDLSENQLTWLSPQLLRSLGSLRSIRLHGNPWACLCDAEDFVVSVRDLQNRSVLVQPTQVTCETPPTLKGQPLFNVTVCPSTTEPATVITSTGIHVSSSSSVHSKPSFMPFTVLKPSGSIELASSPPLASDSKIFGTLVSIIVLLSVLVCVVCFLVAMHRQKRCSKTVMPGCPEEDQEKQRKQDVSGSTVSLSSKSSELRDPEEEIGLPSRRRLRGGVRSLRSHRTESKTLRPSMRWDKITWPVSP
uniref:LRRCT domain-containing protein n=1 Tax=Oryzias latipes TaxID=8090 RepID=A0A3P9IKC9_ORYLA